MAELNRKRLYKVLDEDMRSPLQRFYYRVGEKYKCKNFNDDPSFGCAPGFYATDIEGLTCTFALRKRIFEVEVWGKSVEYNKYKRRYEYIKLIREVPYEEVRELARKLETQIGYKLSEVLFPVNPLAIPPPEITEEHRELLFQCGDIVIGSNHCLLSPAYTTAAEIGLGEEFDTVWRSLLDRFLDWARSYGDGVFRPTWAENAYIVSLFPSICEEIADRYKMNKYPFQPFVDLWYQGLIATQTRKTGAWCLFGGKEAEILFEKGRRSGMGNHSERGEIRGTGLRYG